MLKHFNLFFIFLLLFVAAAFSFDGNSTSYQTSNQIVSVFANGNSSSYVVNSSSTINGDVVCSTASCSVPAPVTTPTNNGGGGGGSSSSSAPATITNTANVETKSIPLISADEPKTLTFTQTPVLEMTLVLSESVYLSKVSVEKHDSLPAEFKAPPVSKTALIIEFSHDRINNNQFESVSFVVSVPKTADISLLEMGVFRLVDDTWQPIPFTLLNENSTSYKINVTTPGLSYFVIGKKSAQSATTSPVASSQPATSTPTLQPVESDVKSDTSQTTSKKNISYVTLLLIVSALIAGGFVARYVLVKKVEKIQQAPISPNSTLLRFNKLDEWILDGISKGYTAEQLRQRLIASGWKKEQLEEDFRRVLNELYKK